MIILLPLVMIILTVGAMLHEIDERRRTPPPYPPAPGRLLTLTFAGDIMAHDVNYYAPSYEEIYRDVQPLLRTDHLSFGNLEFPVDQNKPYSNYPRFNNHPAYVEAAVEAGFQVFSAANNHSTDQGPESVVATVRYLDKLAGSRAVVWSGLRSHPEDPLTPVELEGRGARIGFLALTFMLNIEEGSGLVYRVDYRSAERREALLRYIRAVAPAYDLFVLSVHGGVEYRNLPLPLKYSYFHQLVEAGVDILWAHHPHVLQPHELVRRPNGEKAVIINSAGNFISGQTWRMTPADVESEDPPRAESALYRVHLSERADGELSICGVEAVPIVAYRHPEHGMIVRRLDGLLADTELPDGWRGFYQRRAEAIIRILEPIDTHNSVQ